MTETSRQAPPRHRATTSAPRTHACVRLVMAALAIPLVAACDRDQLVAPPVAVAPAPESMASLSAEAASDRAILVELYEATDGANWVNNENWLTDAPVREWHGVTADAAGRVTELNLPGNGLSGTIPAELGGLDEMASLVLEENRLSGAIPPEFGNLARLYWLDLGYNDLTGPIPPELGNLARLETLWLARNELEGPIPPELGNLASMWQLGLQGNSLSGTIPPELGGLANLSTFFLNDNNLSGGIPPELGDLASLWELYLSSNSLTGAIPLSFQHLSELEWFHFQDNAGLCLQDEDVLVAWYESLTEGVGPVCPDREVLRALYETASGEGWTNVEGWLGDGLLDDWYGVEVSSGRVSGLDLEANGLSGSLPRRLGDLTGLTTLRIGDNALSGPLPRSLSRTSLRELRYANTDLCVPVETWFHEWLASVPQHEGTGEACPPLTDREILTILYEATAGPNWEASSNWLTGAPLGEWYGVETNADGRVTSLDLRWNGLSGPIPPAIGGLEELRTLILFANELSGPIPPNLGGLAKAELVVLAGNSLSGPIPPELAGLTAVEALYLNGNKLTSVPPEVGRLAELREVSLAGNKLTSIPSIPEAWCEWTNLEWVNLAENEIAFIADDDGCETPALKTLILAGNKLASVPLDWGELSNLRTLILNFNRLRDFPLMVGGYPQLEELGLWSNELTSVPRELGGLANLRILDLDENRLTSLPAELGRLANLEHLWLASNELTSVPAELARLVSLSFLDLSSNEFAFFPRTLAELDNLSVLELDGNRLTDVPAGLANANRMARRLRKVEVPSGGGPSEPSDPWRVARDGSQRKSMARKQNRFAATSVRRGAVGGPSAASGGFPSLEILDLSSNAFSGSLPVGLIEFTGLTSLGLAGNTGLTGALPLGLTALDRLEDFHTSATALCAPRDPAFFDWLEGVTRQRVALCERHDDATAYLTQAVQSREFPVPLVAGKPALLRVFVTAERETGAAMPPARATFYRDGAVTYQLDIPSKADPIPTVIDESSLSKSVNADVPDWVIQPGLEVVIEPDPEGTLGPALGVASRIPATGRLAVDVRAMPVFEVTLVPFIWEANPDHSILDITSAMAADSHGHELWKRTHELLPISAMDVRAHGSVLSSTNNGFEILEQTEMVRVMEGGRGHYLGVMAGPTGPGGLLGVAYGIGSWSSFSVLDAETIAHEFGHNRNLYHAPVRWCRGAGPVLPVWRGHHRRLGL